MNSLLKRLADTVRALVFPQRRITPADETLVTRREYIVSGWKPCWGPEWQAIVEAEFRKDPAAEDDAGFRFVP